jgi:hypothetical protein
MKMWGRLQSAEGVAKLEEPLACARGSAWRWCICKTLPSRDREGVSSTLPKEVRA